jgi:putative lipoprotein (rSAM/lipoprotein system)
MQAIKRVLLWIITVAIPVTIAACYGVAYRFSALGKVVDADTGDPIEGIQVSCLDADGLDMSTVWSDEQGQVTIDYDEPCDKLRAVDVDEAENGSYASKDVPFDGNASETLIEMDPL